MKIFKKIISASLVTIMAISTAISTASCLGGGQHEHSVVTTPKIDATCQKEGKTEGKYCFDCGEVLQKSQVIPKTDHRVVTVPAEKATCYKDGKTEEKYCRDCGEVLLASEKVNASHEEPLIVYPAREATCSSLGWTGSCICFACKEKEQMQIIPMTAHDYKDGVCQNCGDQDTKNATDQNIIKVDGSVAGTGNETSAIQKAINDCPSGGTVYIPAGTYKITSTVKMKSDITIKGCADTVICPDEKLGTSSIFQNALVSQSDGYMERNITIDRITFDGVHLREDSGSLLSFFWATDVEIKNSTFKNCYAISLGLGGCKNVTVKNCLFEKNGLPKPSTISRPALWTDYAGDTPAKNIQVYDSVFRNNEWSGCYFMPHGGKIIGCSFIDNGESSIYTNQNARDIEYINNYVNGARKSNISCTGIETCATGLLVEGNVIENCGAAGLALTNLENAVVRNNAFFNNGQETGEGAIFIYSLKSVDDFNIDDGAIVPKNILIENNFAANSLIYNEAQPSFVLAWKNEYGKPIEQLTVKNNQFVQCEHGEFYSIGCPINEMLKAGYVFENNGVLESLDEKYREKLVLELESRRLLAMSKR